MPNPTPLVAHARQVRDTWQRSQENAQKALKQTQESLDEARKELAKHVAKLAETEQDLVAHNAALPAAETPADQEALVAKIAELRAAARALQAAILDVSEKIEFEQASAGAATSALRRATDRLRAALEALRVAEEAGKRRASLAAELGRPPLQTLEADAAAALQADPYLTAKQRIQAEIPVKLRGAARRGYAVDRTRLDGFGASAAVPEDLLSAAQQSGGGALGLVFLRQVKMAEAERALREWVERGRERFDRAQALLRDVANTNPLLTTEQKKRLDDLKADGEAAADLRLDREEKREAVHLAQAKLENARLTALAPDPNAKIGDVKEVEDAQKELDDARKELDDAQVDYDEKKADYTAWAAAVPDGVWRRVLGFFEAEEILKELSNAAPADLVPALGTAETELAAALAAAERDIVTIGFLSDQLALRLERVADTRAARQMRLLSAVRGDA